FNRLQHDDSSKILFKQTGNWDGGDVIRMLLEQPGAAHFLVRKLYRHFISEEETPPARLLEPLAEQLRKSEYDVGGLMRTMLRSRHFFSAHAYRRRIKAPVEFVVGLLRSLEGKIEGGETVLPLPAPMNELGQTLFAPPNVKGWDGGQAWLNSATLLARHNMAWRFVQGGQNALGIKVNPSALVQKNADRKDYARQADFLLDLLLQTDKQEVAEQARQKLAAFLA